MQMLPVNPRQLSSAKKGAASLPPQGASARDVGLTAVIGYCADNVIMFLNQRLTLMLILAARG